MGNEHVRSHSVKNFAALVMGVLICFALIGGLIALTDAYGDRFGAFMVAAPVVVNILVLVVLALSSAMVGLAALSLSCRICTGRWWS